MSSYETLLSPIQVGPVQLRNRVALPPMGAHLGTIDGYATEAEAAYYGARAAGGAALIMTGAVFIQDDLELIFPGMSRITSDDFIPGLKLIADAIHEGGALASIQLTPGLGRNNQMMVDPSNPPVSASAVPAFSQPDLICRELTTEEVELLITRYGEAARRAQAAGFDAIDVHAHTGYLGDQFLSECWNQRTDRFGGSPENRARFATEVAAEIRRVAPEMMLSLRFTVEHKAPGGRTWDETEQLLPYLDQAGYDLILCDNGSYEAMDYVFPPYYLGDDMMVDAAARVRPHLSVPVLACGNVTPESGEQILQRGDADLIGIGRGLIADPELVNKLHAGDPAAVRPCIRCNQMCIGNVMAGAGLGCAVNPQVGKELEGQPQPAENPRTIAVVGAGPAGLEFARVAGERGHTVHVYDQREKIGGVLLPAASPDFKRELNRMMPWWQEQLDRLDSVHLHLGEKISADDSRLRDADQVVVASGSHPFIPRVITVEDDAEVIDVLAMHEGAPVGNNVLILGGGLSGADCALELAQDGHQVTVVETAEEIARDMLLLNRLSLLQALGEAGVQIRTSTTVQALTADGVVVNGPEGEQTLQADTVITAFGLRPATEMMTELTAAGIEAQAIGDCVAPRKVGDAINEGYALAATI